MLSELLKTNNDKYLYKNWNIQKSPNIKNIVFSVKPIYNVYTNRAPRHSTVQIFFSENMPHLGLFTMV